MLQLFGRTLSKTVKDIYSSEINYLKNVQGLLSTSELSLIKTPYRTTFIVKRTYPVPLLKAYADPKKFAPRRKKFKLYELVKCTEAEPEGEIPVILKTLVSGLGESGDLVTVKRSFAYNKLLLPGLAEYATEEAIQKAREKEKNVQRVVTEERFSSIAVPRTMSKLSNLIVIVTMHQENKWIVEPWHIRSSFRKAGVHIMRDDCIEMPKNRIEGPNLSNEGKEFLVNIIINKKEKVPVRCRLHHFHHDVMKRPLLEDLHYSKRVEPLFEEDRETLLSMPLPQYKKRVVID